MLNIGGVIASMLLAIKVKPSKPAMQKIPIPTLYKNTQQVLSNLGHSDEAAKIITDTLMYAELRGNNQGLIKLTSGYLKPNPVATAITTKFESPVSARISGGQNIGMVVVSKAVDIAITKAKASGICVVGCSGYSSATGALGCWTKKIADEGFIGIVMSQCNEMVAPYGSYEPIFGTNPIAISIPMKPFPINFDMATSASAYFGIKMAERDGQLIPDDIAYDDKGYSTTNPAEALKGAIRVFDRSFKGSNIALIVELLAGAWTGAAMVDKTNSNNWGSVIIVIDPTILGPTDEFNQNVQLMCNRVKNAKRLPGTEGEIFLPGERGDQKAATALQAGSVAISQDIYNDLLRMLEK